MLGSSRSSSPEDGDQHTQQQPLEEHLQATLLHILISDEVAHVKSLLKSSPTGLLLSGSDHYTRTAIINSAAPSATHISASLYVIGAAPRETLQHDAVIVVQDADSEGPDVEGALKELFLLAREAQTIVGLATSDAAIQPSLRRANRFERIHRIRAPSSEAREKACAFILTCISSVDQTFHFSQETPTELASISPGYGLPDFASILNMYVTHSMSHARSLPESSQTPMMPLDFITEMIARHQPMRGSVDLDFVTANSHAPDACARELAATKSWGTHAGYPQLKHSLIRLFEWPISHRATFLRLGVRPPRGVLLHGPHGCGKTMIAFEFLRRLRYANWLHVHAPDLFSKYLGESELRVRQLFARAAQLSPCVVFLDELDAIGGSRSSEKDSGSGVERRVLASLLTELDGISGGDLFILACASDKSKLDAALLRPGRLDNVLEVGLPQHDDRRGILEALMRKIPTSGKRTGLIDTLAVLTDGMSGAELDGLCREAVMIAIEDNDGLGADFATLAHFEGALHALRRNKVD